MKNYLKFSKNPGKILAKSSVLINIQINSSSNELFHSLYNFAKILINFLEFIFLIERHLIAASFAKHFVNLRNKSCWSENFDLLLKFAYPDV